MITPFPITRHLDTCPRCSRPRPVAVPSSKPDPVEREGAFDRSDFLAELRRNFRYDPGLDWAEAVRP
jgi:hypothetical protein